MRNTSVFLMLVLTILVASQVPALTPGTDVVIPAAVRGGGLGGSVWTTALYITNPGSQELAVTVAWLVRGQANPQPVVVNVTVAAGATEVFADAPLELFGLSGGAGALRVQADQPLVVTSAILNLAGGSEYGQGFEGVPLAEAVTVDAMSRIPGGKATANHRTNIYLIDAWGLGSKVSLTAVDPSGAVLGQKSYDLGVHMPVLEPLSSLGVTQAADVTILVSVDEGAVIAGASRINSSSGDPLTLAASHVPGAGGVTLCAPKEISGLKVRVRLPHSDRDDEVFEIDITSETTAVIDDGHGEIEATFTYIPFGSGARFVAEIPGFNLTSIRATALCETSTSGVVVGIGETPFGEVTIKATAELIE
jgi:hypothetical protein